MEEYFWQRNVQFRWKRPYLRQGYQRRACCADVYVIVLSLEIGHASSHVVDADKSVLIALKRLDVSRLYICCISFLITIK